VRRPECSTSVRLPVTVPAAPRNVSTVLIGTSRGPCVLLPSWAPFAGPTVPGGGGGGQGTRSHLARAGHRLEGRTHRATAYAASPLPAAQAQEAGGGRYVPSRWASGGTVTAATSRTAAAASVRGRTSRCRPSGRDVLDC